MWGKLNLTRKMALSIVLGLLIVFAGSGFLTFWTLHQSSDRTLNERLLLAKVVARSLDHYNQSVIEQLQEMASSANPQTNVVTTEQLNEARSRLRAEEVILLDNHGAILSVQPAKEGMTGQSLYDLGYISQGHTLDKPYISGVVSSFVDNSSMLMYLVPIATQDATVSKVFGVGISLADSQINGFIEAINLGKTGYAQVVDDKGALISSTQPAGMSEAFDHGQKFAPLIQAGRATVRTCHRCHEPESTTGRQKDIMAFAPLSSGASWGVAIRQSESEALGPTRRLEEGMIIVGGSSLFLALLFSITFAGRLVKPLRMLTGSAQRIAGGDLSGTVKVKGKDEVATLAEAFETMRTKLESARKEIDARTEDIERRKREAEALYELSVKTTSLLDVDKILNLVVEKARELLVTDVAVLSLLEKEQGEIYIRATSGTRTESFSRLTLKFGEGFTGKLIELGHPLFVDNYLSDKAISHDERVDSIVREEGLVSHFGVPLSIGDRIIGSLTVAQRSPREFQERETNLLSRLANQAALAIDNTRLYAEVQSKEELRGELLQRIISVQEEERKRIAQGLHDELAQALSSFTMRLEAIEAELPSELQGIKDDLTKLRALSARSLEDVRRLIADLRPMALDDLGLVSAIRWYANSHLGERGIDVRVKSSIVPQRLPPSMETVLFRVAQEAINNIAKHAECHNARINLESDANSVRLVIEDDGKGFDVASVLGRKDSGNKLGLLGMQERVTLFQGKLHIKSRLNKGTTVIAEIPLGREE